MSVNKDHYNFLIKAGLIVGSGGLIFGYDIGVISGTLTKLDDQFDLKDVEVGLIVAILYVGSIIGSAFGGAVCDYLGRWKTIHLQNLLFCVGSIVTGCATNITMLCIGRFIVGVASALSGIADVPYLNEISPPSFRGFLSSQYEIAVSFGVLVSFAVDLALSGLDYGWRIAFVLPSIAAILQSMAMFLLPESPKWLAENSLLNDARRALCCMYGESFVSKWTQQFSESTEDEREANTHELESSSKGTVEIPEDVRLYLEACKREGSGAHTAGSVELSNMGAENQGQYGAMSRFSLMSIGNFNRKSDSSNAAVNAQLFEENSLLKEFAYPAYLIVWIQILAQITGGNVIRNYAPTIFENGGVSTSLSLGFNLLFGVVKLLFTILAICKIDTTGRINFFLIGICLVGTGMLFLAVCSLFSKSGDISNVPAFVVGCCLVYAGFGLGYGPMPWVFSAEMFPTLIRGRIMSISLIASNAAQLVVNFIFLPLCDGITTAGVFFAFTLLNVMTLWFVVKFLVETKEISPEAILRSLLQQRDLLVASLTRRHPLIGGVALRLCCCSFYNSSAENNEPNLHSPTMTAKNPLLFNEHK